MQSRKKQIGGMYNTLFLLLCIGAVVLLTLAVAPVYMNEGKLNKIVSQVAAQSGSATASKAELRQVMKKRWSIDDVQHVSPEDISFKKTKNGKTMSYDYEVRIPLFANWDLVLSFSDSFPLSV